MSGPAVVADFATTAPLFNLPEFPDSSTCKQSLQVAITEVLTMHAKSYNTVRSGVGFVACRCGLVMELDGSSTADDARTFAAHQAQELAK